MFTVERLAGEAWEAWALADTTAGSRVQVATARGGMVTGFAVRGRDVLYIDKSTLADGTKNVRGGIPVLFPAAGRLPGDGYTVDGQRVSMGQHGFARGMPWRVEATGCTDAAEITVGLTDTQSTRAVYPYGFHLGLTYTLAGDRLAVTTRVTATGERSLPVHLGFHPYLALEDRNKAGATVRTDATRAWDNRVKAPVAFTGWDLTAPEVDLHLLDHRLSSTELHGGDGSVVTVAMDPAFSTLVVWTLGGRAFVCVEPWTAPAGALATGEGLVTVAPGDTWTARWSITPG